MQKDRFLDDALGAAYRIAAIEEVRLRLIAYLSLMAKPDAEIGDELIETLTEREGISRQYGVAPRHRLARLAHSAREARGRFIPGLLATMRVSAATTGVGARGGVGISSIAGR